MDFEFTCGFKVYLITQKNEIKNHYSKNSGKGCFLSDNH